MTKDIPESPADPRPNDEPYWIENECEDCGSELKYQHEVQPWKYDSEREFFYDEFMCPECREGVYMDWPDSQYDRLMEKAEKADKEDWVSLEEMKNKLGLEE